MTNLRLCDNCKSRNIMCCICTDNSWYREGKFSHDKWVRAKAIDDVLQTLSEYDDILSVIPTADLQGIICVIEQLKECE